MNAIAQCTDDTRAAKRAVPHRNNPCCDYFDALLRRLQMSHNGTPAPKVIGIAGCARGVGVSTVAANLAIRAADRANEPVLLVDANLRHSSLQQLLDASSGPGVSEVLSGSAAVTDCITPCRVEGLSLMRAGGSTSPVATGGQAAVAECFAQLRPHFSWIVVDLPPVDELSPCWDLIGQMDGVLLVIEAEKTRHEAAQLVKRRLSDARAHLLGVVLNKRSTHIPDWLYRLL